MNTQPPTYEHETILEETDVREKISLVRKHCPVREEGGGGRIIKMYDN
jgi:hypothetical protein